MSITTTRNWTFERLCQQKKLMKLLPVEVRREEIVVGRQGNKLAYIGGWYSYHNRDITKLGYKEWSKFDIHYWIAGVLVYGKR